MKNLTEQDILLKIENLTTSFRIDEEYFPAVDDVSSKFYLQFKYLFLFVSILSKKVKTLNF